MTHDTTPTDDTRLTIRVLVAVLLVVILAVALVMNFGLPALGFLGLAATILVFVIMLAFTAGN
ncbi:hypothetical protein [Paracoccus siganidrum]|uniref:Uncharacterized protein n=1 Tax=Paracoccus siganidrum TaxID=1276757 RepID=A0A419A5F5_9RHOB|nr:hypothetical protein [Paracoccus siganidrum]RJL11685.1 hypothetical protein D3P05_13035 [Paracoccus siganidrum]RMC41175.1 hypothetical protein C9E82_01160 [Paracoccus siganidrum]